MRLQGNLCLMHIAKGSALFNSNTATTTTTGFNTHCYMIPAGSQVDVAEHLYAVGVKKASGREELLEVQLASLLAANRHSRSSCSLHRENVRND